MSRKIFIKKVIDKIKSKNYNARMELKEYREKIKQTQQQVADTLGISRQYVSDLERKSVMPSRKLAEKIVMWSDKQITFAELWNWQ
jgi:DNA-binding XRE family transcriptional regulator